MKYSFFIVTTITLMAAFVLSGCDNQSNKVDEAEISVIEAKKDLEIAKSEVKAEIRKYRAENAERIEEYNQTISDIKQKIENESDNEVKEELEEKLEDIKDSHRELKREMDDYEASGRENWEEFKDTFSNKMDDLGDSLKDFFSNTNTTASSTN